MKKILILAILMSAAMNAFAAVNGNASIIFPLLDLGAGARALGMGEAFTAVADDASAIYWNAGGLGNIRKAQVGLTYDKWFVDTFFDQVLFALPLPAGTIGANIVYMDMGSIQGRLDNGTDTSKIYPYSMAGCLGYGISFGNLAAGLAVKMINQSTGTLSNMGFAGDIGLLFKTGIFSAGLNMQNLGSGGNYYLPMNLKAGIALRPLNSAQNSLLIAVDTQYLFRDAASLSAGLEYVFDGMLAARLGYEIGFGSTDLDGIKGISGGVGVKYQNFNLDYAIVPYGDLGITHRVMLSYVFPGPASAKPVDAEPVAKHTKEKAQEPDKTVKELKAPADDKKAKKSKTKAQAAKISAYSAAMKLEKAGKVKQAIDKYKEAVLEDGKNADAWKRLASLYQNGSDKKDAVTCYETYLMLNPADTKTADMLKKYKMQ